jgi:hypothetical protein
MYEFQIIAGGRTPSQNSNRGRDVAEDRAIHQYLSDCKDAIAHVMRSSRGIYSLAVKRQGDSGSLDQTL